MALLMEYYDIRHEKTRTNFDGVTKILSQTENHLDGNRAEESDEDRDKHFQSNEPKQQP